MSRIFDALQIGRFVPSAPSNVPDPPHPINPLFPIEPCDQIVRKIPSVRESLPPSSRLVSLQAEHSLAAEKFRFLAVRLRHLQQKHAIKKLLVTSTISEEGKSFVSMNVAITLARKQRQKVLLIDGDLRRPRIANEFGLQHSPGLAEALADECDRLKPVVYLEDACLWFMPAGSPPENPLELMQTPRLTNLLKRLTAPYDWVVIDSPPILPLADTTVWSRLVDGVLLVTREGKTEKDSLKRGLEALGKTTLVGVVLNSCSNVDQGNYYQRYGALSGQNGKSVPQRLS